MVDGTPWATICLPLEMERNQLSNEKELEGKDLVVAGWGFTSVTTDFLGRGKGCNYKQFN